MVIDVDEVLRSHLQYQGPARDGYVGCPWRPREYVMRVLRPYCSAGAAARTLRRLARAGQLEVRDGAAGLEYRWPVC